MKKSNTTLKRIKVAIVTLICIAATGIRNQTHAQCPTLGTFSGLTGDLNACPGMVLTYTLAPVNNAISYTWYLPPGATINGQNPYTTASNVVTVTYGPLFSAPGNICVYATNGCATIGPYCKSLTPAGQPSGASVITGSVFACPGNVQTYSVTNQVNRVFNWTVPNNSVIVSGQGTNSITVQYNAGFNGGNVCVRVGNGCAWSGFRCMTINAGVPGTPTAIVGPVEVCGGQTGTFSTGPSNGVPVSSYTWTAPAGAVITGQGNSTVQITFPSNYNLADIYVKANNGCGSSGNRSLRVRAVPEVPQPITGIAAGICNGTTPYSVQASPTAVSYNWTLTGPGTITSGQGTNNININYPPSFVSGKICVTITNSCATGGPRCLNTSKEVQIAQQPQNFETCNKTNASMSVDAIGMNLQYQWRKNGQPLSNGGVISGANSQTLTFTNADSLDAGSYDVIVSTLCGSSITSTAADLLIKQVPAKPGTISGVQATTCPGTTGIVYSVPLQPDATGFLWSHSDGVEILSGQGTDAVTLKFDSTINSGYSVYVVGTNECGSGLDSSKSWTRYKLSTPVITGPARVCDNLPGITYLAPPVAGASSYTWNAPAGATIVSGQGTNSVTVDFGAAYTGGDMTVTASNICFTTPVKKLSTVIDVPAVPATITGQAYGACNTQLNYSAGSSNYATSYTWTLPTGATIASGAGTNAVAVDFVNPGTGTYNICVAGTNYCRTGTPRCMQIRAIPDRPATIVSTPGTFCANQSGVQFATAGSIGSDTYTWTVPNGTVIASGQGTANMIANIGSNNGNVTVKGNNTCGSSSTRTLSVVLTCREAGEDINGDATSVFAISPNPAHEWVKISFGTSKAESYSIKVYDILGKLVLTEGGISNIGLNEHSLSVGNLVKGIYIVSLEGNNITRKQKLEIK